MSPSLPTYTAVRAVQAPALRADWQDAAWLPAAELEIAHFRPESSPHHPRTLARLVYDDEYLHGIFRVEDRYVRCTRTRYMDAVYKDSCVEFFVEPPGGKGYFNFEFNCGGALLCSHVRDFRRTPAGLADALPIPEDEAARVGVRSSLDALVEPEVAEPLTWTLQFRIPFALLAAHAGAPCPAEGQVWRANFYKCAEENSHPHWAAWSPVDELNFHLPRCFGELRFA